RGWAVRDAGAGEMRGAKKLPKLLLCRARYAEEPTADHVPAAEITLPDGSRMWSNGGGAPPPPRERLCPRPGPRPLPHPRAPAGRGGPLRPRVSPQPGLRPRAARHLGTAARRAATGHLGLSAGALPVHLDPGDVLRRASGASAHDRDAARARARERVVGLRR